jgi:conjugative transfer region lipoprotein (TIGR03751 family)
MPVKKDHLFIMLRYWIKIMVNQHGIDLLAAVCQRWMMVIGLVSLSACSLMGNKETILPQNGASMKEVYDAHFKHTRQRHNSGRESVNSNGVGLDSDNLAGFSRNADNEIQTLFPRLPNPPLVMYIYPHLTDTGQAVPGYATSFSMYEKTEYALPGETEGRQ